jgi:hypothetical protein
MPEPTSWFQDFLNHMLHCRNPFRLGGTIRDYGQAPEIALIMGQNILNSYLKLLNGIVISGLEELSVMHLV